MKSIPFFKYWLPVILYAAAIFSVSSMPQTPAPYLFEHSDMLFHFLAYMGFGFIILRALDSSRESLKGQDLRILAFLLALFYGITDELHQYFVPGRNMQITDVMSDGLGAYIGQWLFKLRK
jgi:VanZ family protein